MAGLNRARDIYRSVSQFHENENLVAWLRDRRWVIWLTAARRRKILLVGSVTAGIVTVFHHHAPWRQYLQPDTWLAPALAVALLFLMLKFIHAGAARFSDLPGPIRRRPQIAFHTLFWSMVIVTWLTPVQAGTWRTVIALMAISFPFIIWRCGYMLISAKRGRVAGTGLGDHLIYIWPIWGGTNTPIGKGADYLSQCEARTADAYARAVLSGIKLMILARLWGLARQFMAAFVYANPKSFFTPLLGGFTLTIPRAQSLVTGQDSDSVLISWVSLYMDLIWETLEVAEDGHVWVGALRLFGFNVFRNTYKPLLARSVIDFWNRWHYYFKEMLVEFFFLPTYARHFQKAPKLRIFAAIFASAFVGNMYHHLLKAKKSLVGGAWLDLWLNLNPRLVYCLLLALGLYLSMLREQHRRGKGAEKGHSPTALSNLAKIAWVWTFYSLVHIWNLKGTMTVESRTHFFLSLFGLSF